MQWYFSLQTTDGFVVRSGKNMLLLVPRSNCQLVPVWYCANFTQSKFIVYEHHIGFGWIDEGKVLLRALRDLSLFR